MSELLKKAIRTEIGFSSYEPCPACGSRDNLGRYEDGHGFCFGCHYYEHAHSAYIKGEHIINEQYTERVAFTTKGTYQGIEARKISKNICKQYSYSVGIVYNKPCHIANFYDSERKVVGQKYRFENKKFSSVGDCTGLWGKWLWTNGKKIVITEGEIDCLSVAEAQDGKWPTVSVPNGTGGAKKCLKENLEWLEQNFDEIVLMFDMDEPGQTAAKDCAQLFTPGKCKIANLTRKDANELLCAGEPSRIISGIWNAAVYRPDGIINAKDTISEICNAYKSSDSFYPWSRLNEITRGIRLGEIVTFCAGTGIGKSQIMRELAYHIIKDDPKTMLGYIALEESLKRTAFGLMSIEANKPLHLDKNLNEEELRDYHRRVFEDGRVYLYDHWGSLNSDSLLSKIRYLANGCGVSWIILDHISIVISGMEGGDERRSIDNLMTNLRKIVEELNVGLLLVSHLKRPEGKAHEEGAKTTLGQLRGSAAIAQLSDIVIGLERNQQDEERKHLSTVRVLKNRFTGDTGIAGELRYNPETGRMTEEDNIIDEEEVKF